MNVDATGHETSQSAFGDERQDAGLDAGFGQTVGEQDGVTLRAASIESPNEEGDVLRAAYCVISNDGAWCVVTSVEIGMESGFQVCLMKHHEYGTCQKRA